MFSWQAPSFVIFIGILVLSVPQVSHSTMLELGDKQLILDIHNWLRSQTAQGVNAMSSISNMRTMGWSDELESKSLFFRSKCDTTNKPQNSSKYDENDPILFYKFKFKTLVNSKNISSILKTIFIKLDILLSGPCQGKGKCRKINQILEPQASLVGCSMFQCTPFNLILTCIYDEKPSPKAHLNLENFGKPCSNCSKEFSYCLNNSLCATESQCSKSSDRRCRCLVKNDICTMNGVFFKGSCQCICNPGFQGINCQETCQDSADFCQVSKPKCLSKSTEGLHVRKFCPETCNLCSSIVHSSTSSLSNLLVKLEDDPFQLGKTDQCSDKHSLCKSWLKKGLCLLKVIQTTCANSCKKCHSEYLLRQYNLDFSSSNQQKKDCLDQKNECRQWAKENYCYMSIVQIKCPFSCGTCAESLPTDQVNCEEKPPRLANCQLVLQHHLCSLSSMKQICPMTCLNPKCANLVPPTVSPEMCTEPESRKQSCREFKLFSYCTVQEIRDFCPLTCQVNKCYRGEARTIKPQVTSHFQSPASVSKEPPLCKSTGNLCQNPTVALICKEACGASSVDIVDVEPPFCSASKEFCSNPSISIQCKKTCETVTYSTSTMPTISPQTDPPLCIDLAQHCSDPKVSKMCKVTCQNKMTYWASTMQAVSPQTDPPACIDLAAHCSDPFVSDMCKVTCQAYSSHSKLIKTTPSQPIVDDLQCNNMVIIKFCSDPDVKRVCPKTCQANMKYASLNFINLSTSMKPETKTMSRETNPYANLS